MSITNVRLVYHLSSSAFIGLIFSCSVCALMPIMQVYLYGTSSSDKLVRRINTNQLHSCLEVLSVLRKTFWHAEWVYHIFIAAQRKIKEKLDLTPTVDSQHEGRILRHRRPTPPVNTQPPVESSPIDLEASTLFDVDGNTTSSAFALDFLFPPEGGLFQSILEMDSIE